MDQHITFDSPNISGHHGIYNATRSADDKNIDDSICSTKTSGAQTELTIY